MEAAARGKRALVGAGVRGASSSSSESPMGRHVVYVRVRVRVCEYSLLGRGPAHSFGLTSELVYWRQGLRASWGSGHWCRGRGLAYPGLHEKLQGALSPWCRLGFVPK